MKRRTFVFARLLEISCLIAMSHAPLAWALDTPKDKVVLTITGKVGAPNKGSAAVFDMPMLQKLPQRTFTTQTPWEPKPTMFAGPLLRDVLAAAEASGARLEATALNDYKVTFPLSDAKEFDVVIAIKMNGEDIPVRTKGPLFIVYPFDSKPELKAAKYYERSIWQLKSLTTQ